MGTPVLIFTGYLLLLTTVASTRPSYRAAVYEHAVVMPLAVRTVSREHALRNMKKNLDIYAEQVRIASNEDVDIIVFPEDGVYGMNFNRDTIKPYLEDIPDPKHVAWNPCNNEIAIGYEVQRRLSCMAREHNMYVVANMGDKKSCNSSTQNCVDGQFQYNTDVVFNTEGTLIARYHKQNLYFESQFNAPEAVEKVTFDTPFGKFGIFTCFDVLFKSPAVDLIEELGVQNIVFPTAWMDSLPLLAAIQFHSAFAKHFKVNFLAANIHFPLYNFHGSGIYSPKRTESYYYNDNLFSGGKLLIADVKSNPTPHRRFQLVPDLVRHIDRNELRSNTNSETEVAHSSRRNHIPHHHNHLHPEALVPRNRHVEESNHVGRGRHHHVHLYSLSSQMIQLGWVHMLENQDNYQYIPLIDYQAKVKICQGEICCYLDYEKQNRTRELYALGVFDGLHQIDGLAWYTQVCVLLKCESTDFSSCGKPTKEAHSHFEYLKLWGTFTTPYVFPQVLVSHRGQLRLEHEHWKYLHNRIEFVNRGNEKPLLSASLYGRIYSRDNTTHAEMD